MKRALPILIALTLTVAACGKPAEETTTTAVPTTTAAPTTTTAATTTTAYTGPVSLLNGLPISDDALLDRRVIAVKIDNHWDARPQSGIELADAVIELRVEGGLTRWMALFHTGDAEYLGPIRSGRPADAKVVRGLEAVMFTSGAQPWVQKGIKEVGTPMFIDVRPGMFRITERFAPHNLYGDTNILREFADSQGLEDTPPPAGLWEIGPFPADTETARQVNVSFSEDFYSTWRWSGSTWERFINGDEPSETVDQEGTTTQITADTLVMIVGAFYTASPPAGQSGSPVPSTETVGTGRVIVFSDGKAVEGTWERETAEEPFVLKTAGGDQLLVPAGRVWISIVPDIGTVTWG
jgi:hypothetical protein